MFDGFTSRWTIRAAWQYVSLLIHGGRAAPEPHALSWLTSRRVTSLIKRNHEWVLQFEPDVAVTLLCIWRLVEGGRICVTSEDDGRQFGLPAPLDAQALVNQKIATEELTAVVLDEANGQERGHA